MSSFSYDSDRLSLHVDPITTFPSNVTEESGLLAGRSVTKKDTEDTPTISKTHRMSMASFKGIGVAMRALFLLAPIMFVAVPLTLIMWTGQAIANRVTGGDSLPGKTFKFAMTKLFGCDGKKIIGLENVYGQTYRSRDLIVQQSFAPPNENDNTYSLVKRGSITLGDIPTGMSRDSIINEANGAENLHVIDLTEIEERTTTTSGTPVTQAGWERLGVTYVNHKAKDLVPLDVESISKVVEEMREAVLNGKNVYIHCKAGVGRSATILAAYLAKYGSNDEPEAAVKMIPNGNPMSTNTGTPMSANKALQYIEERRFINLSKGQSAKVHEFKAMSTILDAVKANPSNKTLICEQLSTAITTRDISSLTDPIFTYLKHAITEGTEAGKAPDLSSLKTALAEIQKITDLDNTDLDDSGIQI